MTAPAASATNCSATNAAGHPCRSIAVLDCGHCSSHCPDRVVEMMEARRRGGRNSSNVERQYSRLPDDLKAVAKTLAEVLVEVREGTLPPAVGNAVASLARALVGTIESANVETRVGDLEDLLTRIGETIELKAAG